MNFCRKSETRQHKVKNVFEICALLAFYAA